MSTLKVNDIQEATSGGGKIFPARAWVTFNGQGSVSIREDGNVSSITDNGTGDYTTNFSSSLSSSNYTTTGSSSDDSMHGRILTGNESPATGSRRFRIITDANSPTDEQYVYALFIV